MDMLLRAAGLVNVSTVAYCADIHTKKTLTQPSLLDTYNEEALVVVLLERLGPLTNRLSFTMQFHSCLPCKHLT